MSKVSDRIGRIYIIWQENLVIFGGEGDDTLYGDEDGDVLRGDSGFDSIFGGEGYDIIDGGDGRDSCGVLSETSSDLAVRCE